MEQAAALETLRVSLAAKIAEIKRLVDQREVAASEFYTPQKYTQQHRESESEADSDGSVTIGGRSNKLLRGVRGGPGGEARSIPSARHRRSRRQGAGVRRSRPPGQPPAQARTVADQTLKSDQARVGEA